MDQKCPYHNYDAIREFDALNPDARANPYPYFDWLRADPRRVIYPLPQEQNFFVVHRFEEVKQAFSDEENFHSQIIPTVKSPFFVLMNGPEHRRIRSVMSAIFSPARIEANEETLKKEIHQFNQQLLQGRGGDLLANWAIPIPLAVLATFFDFATDSATLKKLEQATYAINRALFVVGGTGPRRSPDPSWKEKFQISSAILKNIRQLYEVRKIGRGKGGRRIAEHDAF